jgi:hypothetical protein
VGRGIPAKPNMKISKKMAAHRGRFAPPSYFWDKPYIFEQPSNEATKGKIPGKFRSHLVPWFLGSLVVHSLLASSLQAPRPTNDHNSDMRPVASKPQLNHF